MDIKVGDVFFCDNALAVNITFPSSRVVGEERVLVVDDFEVYTDGKFRGENEFIFNKKIDSKGKEIFRRTNRSLFEKCIVKKLQSTPLSEEIIEKLYLNLPMRIGRLRKLSWDSEYFNTLEVYLDYIKKHTKEMWSEKVIALNSLYVIPYTMSEFPKKPVKVESDNSQYFTVKELLWKAAKVRNAFVKGGSEGVGLYRSGIYKGLPSYYIWGCYDLAGFLREYEKNGIDIENA